jgi:hypothetical protein
MGATLITTRIGVIAATLAALFSADLLSAQAPATTAALSAGSLADLVRASNVLTESDFETTFEVTHLGRRPIEVVGPWDRMAPDLHDSFSMTVIGGRMSLLRVNLLEGSSTTRYEQRDVWANGTLSRRIRGENVITLEGAVAPPDLFGYGHIFNLMESRFGSPSSLELIVRGGRCTSQSVDDGTLLYQFEAVGLPSGAQRYELRAELSPRFRLLSFMRELYQERDATEPSARETYTVRAWREVDGLLIPESADVMGWRPANPIRNLAVPTVSRREYRRIDFKRSSPALVDEAIFDVPMPTGTMVRDDRLNMSYNIGQAFLLLDGVSYQLREPLMEPPGDRLTELIQTAVRMQGTPSTRGASEGGDAARAEPIVGAPIKRADSRLTRFAIPSALGAALIAGVFIVVMRARAARGTR